MLDGMVGQGGRGPGRSEAARVAILTAVANRVITQGYEHLTMEGVAAEAKVGKQTIYRWWSSRSALVADCLIEGMLIPDWFVPADSGDLRADARAWLENISGFLRTPGNADLLRSLLVAASENEEVAERLGDRLGVWAMLGDRFAAAIRSGQLPEDSPVTEIGEALIGTIVLRALRRGDFDDDFPRHVVDAVLPAPT